MTIKADLLYVWSSCNGNSLTSLSYQVCTVIFRASGKTEEKILKYYFPAKDEGSLNWIFLNWQYLVFLSEHCR